MSTGTYVLSVDCGTQSSRAVVWDLSGNPVSEGRTKLKVLEPRLGWYEQDADTWWPATRDAIRQALEGIDSAEIVAMGVTHQRETFAPVSRDGRPLRNAPLYMDHRCLPQVAEAKRTIGAERLHEITGKVPCYLHSIFKILWIMENEPHIHEQTFKYLDVQAYLLRRLVGRYVTSYVSADSTSLVNIRTRSWDTDLMSEFGLGPEQFPELRAPGETAGRVTAEAAKETGLPEGLPVVAIGGDGVCAALGSNTLSTSRAFIIIGTFTALGTYAPEYVIGDSFRTLCSCVAGAYNLEANIAGGHIISWFLENFSGGDPDSDTEVSWEKAAAEIPPGAQGLVTLPHWTGVLAPSWDSLSHGIVAGWSSTHTRAHFYRSILEGIIFEHKLLAEEMTSALGTEFEDIVFVGGGAKSPLWGQIMADVFDTPISLSRTVEVTSLGAAMVVATAMGYYGSLFDAAATMTHTEPAYEPDTRTAVRYRDLYEQVYKPLFPRIEDIMSILGKTTFETSSG